MKLLERGLGFNIYMNHVYIQLVFYCLQN